MERIKAHTDNCTSCKSGSPFKHMSREGCPLITLEETIDCMSEEELEEDLLVTGTDEDWIYTGDEIRDYLPNISGEELVIITSIIGCKHYKPLCGTIQKRNEQTQ